MAASSVFQRSSWKFDQLTPTTGPLAWAKAAVADNARAARLIRACFFDSIGSLLNALPHKASCSWRGVGSGRIDGRGSTCHALFFERGNNYPSRLGVQAPF